MLIDISIGLLFILHAIGYEMAFLESIQQDAFLIEKNNNTVNYYKEVCLSMVYDRVILLIWYI